MPQQTTVSTRTRRHMTAAHPRPAPADTTHLSTADADAELRRLTSRDHHVIALRTGHHVLAADQVACLVGAT